MFFGGNWKTSRILLTLLVLLAGGFYADVAFLGQQWSDQAHYLLTLLGLLVVILACAVGLLLAFKLAGWLRDRLVAGKDAEFNFDADQDAVKEPPENKQE